MSRPARTEAERAEELLHRRIEQSLKDRGVSPADSEGPGGPIALPSRPFQFVLHFIGYYKWLLLAMVLLELGQAACQILIPKAIQRLIDAALLADNASGSIWTMLSGPMTFFVLLNLGILICSRASGALLVLTGPALRRRVRNSLYQYLQGHSQRYFMGNFAGSLSSRIAEVSMGVNQSLWVVLFDFWPVAVTLSVALIVLANVQATLAGVMGAWAVGYVVVSYLLAMRCREYAKAFAAARSVVSGKIVDAVTNVMNSKLFARDDHERGYLRHYLDHELSAARQTMWFMERMRWFQFVATLSLQVGMIAYAARLWLDGEITAGSFAMVASLLLLVINDIRNLSRRFLEFFEYIGNITDGVGVIIRPHEIIDQAGARELVVARGEIRFEDVDFSYPGGASVFRGLNLTIRGGERVGLVGFSGSGKSTFLNLVLRLFDIQKGRILIDGQDVRDVTQDSLRRAVSVIAQEPML
ncbi:MAG: ABC transporter ATP-binding protein, partial [Vicinamibacterales bacterium]